MQKKTDILTRAVSTVVFTNSVFFLFCVSLIFACFAENTIKIGVSAPPPPKKKKKKQNSKVKKWSKLKLKSGPIMLRNIIGPLFNFKNCVFCCFLACFSKILFFLQGERDFPKQTKTKKNENIGPLFNFKRAKIGPLFNFTAYIYTYIYISRERELLSGPSLAF